MTKLFLSYTATIQGIISGAITAADLYTGLFYLSCSKGDMTYACGMLGWDNPHRFLSRTVGGGTDAHWQAHGALLGALGAAQRDARVRWIEDGKSQRYEDVSRLLRNNGFGQIDARGGRARYGMWHVEGVKERLAEVGLEVEVV